MMLQIMNQFVDLDEDGSFEVHFGKVSGKVLSSPSSSPPTLPKSEKSQMSPSSKRSLFHTVTTPKQNYNVNGPRAQALGLVSQAGKQCTSLRNTKEHYKCVD